MRGGLARRLVLVGAESTGKTTLARMLVDRLCARGGAFTLTRWVPEYGRDFTVEKLAVARAQAALAGAPVPAMEDLVWRTQDFIDVAREQQRREDDAARATGPVLVCDTDAFATGVWHERYLAARSADVESIAADATWPTRFYLLTDPDDVPFVQDGLRDGVAIRRSMTSAFVERLRAVHARWEWIRGGDAEARTVTALAALDAWLGEPWPMAGPGSTGP